MMDIYGLTKDNIRSAITDALALGPMSEAQKNAARDAAVRLYKSVFQLRRFSKRNVFFAPSPHAAGALVGMLLQRETRKRAEFPLRLLPWNWIHDFESQWHTEKKSLRRIKSTSYYLSNALLNSSALSEYAIRSIQLSSGLNDRIIPAADRDNDKLNKAARDAGIDAMPQAQTALRNIFTLSEEAARDGVCSSYAGEPRAREICGTPEAAAALIYGNAFGDRAPKYSRFEGGSFPRIMERGGLAVQAHLPDRNNGPGTRESSYQAARDLCRNAGQVVFLHKHCIIVDRPADYKLDDRGRLHNETGPAIMYQDGCGMFAWHGTSIPGAWVTGRKPSAQEALSQENSEQRRAACEIVGWANVLRQLKSVTIDKDADPQIGELVQVSLPGKGRTLFLKVTCGTGREFALPVPPGMRTALEANAWTYGLEAKDFNIEVRT